MTREDIPIMIELGAEMHKESNYNQWAYNRESCKAMAEMFLKDFNYFSCICEENKIIKGMILGVATQHIFCNVKYAADLLMYVKPEYRKGFIGVRLVKEFKKWAISRNCGMISMGNTTGYQPDKVSRLYERCGLNRIGFIHIQSL